jgi:hypothetical protein
VICLMEKIRVFSKHPAGMCYSAVGCESMRLQTDQLTEMLNPEALMSPAFVSPRNNGSMFNNKYFQ